MTKRLFNGSLTLEMEKSKVQKKKEKMLTDWQRQSEQKGRTERNEAQNNKRNRPRPPLSDVILKGTKAPHNSRMLEEENLIP